MRKAPAARAMRANTVRNTRKVSTKEPMASSDSWTSTSELTTSAPSGSSAAMPSTTCSWLRPSSPMTAIPWMRPSRVKVSRAAWVSIIVKLAPPRLPLSPKVTIPTRSRSTAPFRVCTPMVSPTSKSPMSAVRLSTTTSVGPSGAEPSTIRNTSISGTPVQLAPIDGAPVELTGLPSAFSTEPSEVTTGSAVATPSMPWTCSTRAGSMSGRTPEPSRPSASNAASPRTWASMPS